MMSRILRQLLERDSLDLKGLTAIVVIKTGPEHSIRKKRPTTKKKNCKKKKLADNSLFNGKVIGVTVQCTMYMY